MQLERSPNHSCRPQASPWSLQPLSPLRDVELGPCLAAPGSIPGTGGGGRGGEQHRTRGCEPLLGSVGVPTTHCSVCSILGPQPKLRQNETCFNILLQSFLPSTQCVCLLLHGLLPESRIDSVSPLARSLVSLHGCSFLLLLRPPASSPLLLLSLTSPLT